MTARSCLTYRQSSRSACLICILALVLSAAAAAFGEPLPFPEWPSFLTQGAAPDKGQAAFHAGGTADAGFDGFGHSSRSKDAEETQDADSREDRLAASIGKLGNRLPAAMEPNGKPAAQTGVNGIAALPLSVPGLREAESFEHPDPITESKIQLLSATGLLARQSSISESIIMMERQIRQAELLNRLLELRGPELPVEITPGHFRSFADTPAGRRIANQIAENEINARLRILELRLKEEELENALSGTAAPESSANLSALAQIIPIEEASSLSLLEIFGRSGNLSAVLELDGRGIVAKAGRMLPDGSEVQSVGPETVVITRNGTVTELNIND